jgi:hypothetical protein
VAAMVLLTLWPRDGRAAIVSAGAEAGAGIILVGMYGSFGCNRISGALEIVYCAIGIANYAACYQCNGAESMNVNER